MKAYIQIVLFSLGSLGLVAQTDSSVIFQKRATLVYGTYTLGFGGSMLGLYHLWYKDYPSQSFHFFNDNRQWLGMDKIGHATTAYYLTQSLSNSLLWAHKSKKSAALHGAIGSLLFLSGIEVLDGFSSNWGASPGDVLANIGGTGLYAIQELLWQEQVLQLKFSYSPSAFAPLRPQLLGSNTLERMLKDYNGQTYWLSAGLQASTGLKTLPKWLNIAFGYSATGMIGGKENPLVDANGAPYPTFERNSIYALSLDVNLREIPTKKRWIKRVLNTLSFIKIPFPALSLQQGQGLKFHPVYY